MNRSASGELERERILVLDFGSQFAQLIARRVREQHVYCEIVRHDIAASRIRELAPHGLILSGGPASVYEENAPRCDPGILDLGLPTLGICYGMQLACQLLGGEVQPSSAREFGKKTLRVIDHDSLLSGLSNETTVWMSHGDQVHFAGGEFHSLAETDTCPIAAVRHRSRPIYGLQFHPEVSHTPQGEAILRNFVLKICGCRGSWKMSAFLEEEIARIRAKVGSSRVVCGLSGGVDSAVTAALCYRAIGDHLTCIFVDNGLLRKGERESVEETFREHFKTDLHVVDASEIFLSRLKDVGDPQRKREIIGHTFIDVFKKEASGIADAHYLAQGTL